MTLDLSAAAFLFDMDGTLVDSTALVERTWARFSADHGLDADEVIAFAHGRPTTATVERFVGDRPGLDVAALADALERVDEQEAAEVVEIAGAAALLGALVAQGARVAVVTSARRELARARLAGAGLAVPEVLVGADDVAAGKPDPEGYLAAAAALGADPRDCVAFEDTEAGLRAVLASGATPVVVGGLDADLAAGLARVADWSDVVVTREGDRVRLRATARD